MTKIVNLLKTALGPGTVIRGEEMDHAASYN